MRPFLKIHLTDKPESHQAAQVLEEWKKSRSMSQNFVRAIRLYAALVKGDFSVLQDYFPGMGMGTVGTLPRRVAVSGTPAVEVREIDAETKLENALGLLDGLEF